MNLIIRKAQFGGNLFWILCRKAASGSSCVGDTGLSILEAPKIWNCSCAGTIKAYKADCDSTNLEVASTVNYMAFYNEEIFWQRRCVHLNILEKESCHQNQASNLFNTESSLHGQGKKVGGYSSLWKRPPVLSLWLCCLWQKCQAGEGISRSAASLPEYKFKFLYQHPTVQKEAAGGSWINQNPSAGFEGWLADFSQAISVVSCCSRQLLLA